MIWLLLDTMDVVVIQAVMLTWLSCTFVCIGQHFASYLLADIWLMSYMILLIRGEIASVPRIAF